MCEERRGSTPSAGSEAGSTRGSECGQGRGGRVQVHPGSRPGGRVYPGVRAGRPGLPGGPGREARSTRGSGQGRPGRPGPGPPGVRAGRPGLPGGPGRGGRAKRGAGLPRVRAGEARSRSTRGPGREAGSTPGSERGCLRRGYQVYPLTRRRLRGEKKKETEKEGGEKKTRARAGPLRRATRGHLLPARPLPPGGRTPPGEEGGGGPERPPPAPASARGPLRRQARPGTGAGEGERQKLVSRADSQ